MIEKAIPEAWIDAAQAGFVDAWRLMANALPAGAVDCHDGLAMAATGINFSGCNTVMVTRPPEDPEGALERARNFFDSRNLPWVLYAHGTLADDLAQHVAAVGLRPSYPEPGMFLLPEDVRQTPAIPGFTILPVQDVPTLDLFRATAARGFGASEDGLAIWASPALLETPGLVFFLGLLDGEPVATSCVYALHGIATINMVSTVESHRRRGFGEIMTWTAIEEGFNRGSEAAFLHSSQMGQPVYERMGFRHALLYRIWTSSQPSP
jgi:ribosomal protein S18 acetylase RimI-like enzyme